ncbi:hypothetical protein HYU92_00550 [Candidatus Curtissbacteria bacterium]|nr:hypothetical protein [Candidatus Curtissbacteria bacterium]
MAKLLSKFLKISVLQLLLLTLLASFLILNQPTQAQAQENQFNDGFESGNFSQWTSIYDSPGIVSYDTHSGNYAAEFEGGWKEGSYRSDAILKNFSAPVQTATVEGWVKVIEWAQANADINFAFQKFGAPEPCCSGIGEFWMWGETGGYYLTSESLPFPDNVRFFSHNLPMNQWNHVKITYEVANGGTLRYFENGVLQLTLTNIGTDWRGFKFYAAGCCPPNHPIKFLVDDVTSTYTLLPQAAPPDADAACLQVTATISVGDSPRGIGINQATNRIYVTNPGPEGGHGFDLSVIDGATNEVLTTLVLGDNPIFPAVNPITNRIYVGNYSSNSLSIVDGSTNTVGSRLGNSFSTRLL